VSQVTIESRIRLIRGKKVMLDWDLAELYGVATKVLNQAVKRNSSRFPEDFMFQLSIEEAKKSRSQIVTLKQGYNIKYPPYAFTEYGVAMLSSVLNSSRAIEMNILIIKAFIRLREMVVENADLRRAIETIEKRVDEHDKAIQIAFNTLKQFIEPPVPKKPKIKIGFVAPEK
jgi:phage regulator Rha-like protein